MDFRRILVTGGSGFLGVNLIRYLLARDYEIYNIDLVPFTYDEKGRINSRVGDIRDRAQVDAAMDGVDAVVHCAAALPLYKPADIFSTDVDGTRNVMESARKHGVERVVHISSTAVYGIPDHHPLLEDDPMQGVGPYGEAKVQAEWVAEEFRDCGMVVPVIRPKSFIGPERLGVFAMLYEWAADGHHFPLTGSGRNLYQLLDVEDLCDAIYLSLTLPDGRVNDVFNVGAGEFRSLREDYQAVLDEAGFGKRVVCFPAAPVIWGLRVLELFHLSPLYKWIYETAHKDSFVSIGKAREALGWTPRYSNREALLRNFDWYQKNRAAFERRHGVSHRVPWKQGALSLLKWVF
jgi:nucleoside-diphosphate-sugar epimerase